MKTESQKFVEKLLFSKKADMEEEIASISIPIEGINAGDKAEFYQILSARHTIKIPKLTSKWVKQTVWLPKQKTGGFWEKKPSKFGGVIYLSSMHDNDGDYRLLKKIADQRTYKSDMFAACDFFVTESYVQIKATAAKLSSEPYRVMKTLQKNKKEFMEIYNDTTKLLDEWNAEVDKKLAKKLEVSK